MKTKITIFVLGKYLGRGERLFGWLFWFYLLLYIVFCVVFLFVRAISELFVLAATKSTSFSVRTTPEKEILDSVFLSSQRHDCIDVYYKSKVVVYRLYFEALECLC